MKILTILVLFLAWPICVAQAGEESAVYAKPGLLISAPGLQQLLRAEPDSGKSIPIGDPKLTLIDTRALAAYRAGTIRQARHISIGEWKAAFGDGSQADAWSERLSRVLRSPKPTVVVFDEAVTPNAARAWWILKYWGIQDVRILNGGYKAWLAMGGKPHKPTLDESVVPFQATPDPARLATAEEVLGIAKQGGACLLDTRSDAEHRAGYIPTASHTDWVAYVDRETGKMRSPEELGSLLQAAGFQQDQRSVAYCQTGGRASVVAFAAELMGGKRVANYFGSWGEWSRLPDAPVAKP